MSDREKFLSDLRIGIVSFIALSLLITGVLFAGGDKGLLFQKTLLLKAQLNDISGLKKGATVTMGGMNIGKVTEVAFLTGGTKENLIEVMMEVRSNVAEKIRSDSKPTVRTQGMLGDRYLDIALGSPDAAPYKEGMWLTGSSTSNFDDALHEARATLTETTKLLDAINKQQGSMGQFIYDETFYKKLTAVTTELSEVIQDFKKNPRRYVKLSVF